MTIREMVRDRRKKRHPVRTAVEQDWPEVKIAIDAGEPIESIYWVLKSEGKNVGASPSSFRGAVKYLLANPPESAAATSNRTDDTHEATDRQQFVDSRHKPDWN